NDVYLQKQITKITATTLIVHDALMDTCKLRQAAIFGAGTQHDFSCATRAARSPEPSSTLGPGRQWAESDPDQGACPGCRQTGLHGQVHLPRGFQRNALLPEISSPASPGDIEFSLEPSR